MSAQPDNPWARLEEQNAALRSRMAFLESTVASLAAALANQSAALGALMASLGELPGERPTADDVEPARRGPGRPPKVPN